MLVVHLEQPSPRARYTARHLFERMLGWTVVFVDDREAYQRAAAPKVCHSASPLGSGLHLPDSGALASARPDPHGGLTDKGLSLFPTSFGDDLLASVFFLLAGVDEYTTTSRDRHGRVPSSALFLVRQKAEAIPWVDRWALDLANRIRAEHPTLPAPTRQYKHVLTVDVDNALKYQARSLHRAIGASVKEIARGSISATRERWRVRRGTEADPYAVLPTLLERVRGDVDRAIAFFLMRGGGVYDHGADMRHPATRALVRRATVHAEAGVHPSFDSSERPARIAQERQALAAIVDRNILCTRQHYLRWRMPDTFRTLADMGFQEEHSFGFTDRIGFRRGTCTPFPWYDLEREEETALMCWPFAAMDSALAEHARMDATAAADAMMRLSDAVRAVQGTFVSVWHDRYLSGDGPFAEWPEAMARVVRHARA